MVGFNFDDLVEVDRDKFLIHRRIRFGNGGVTFSFYRLIAGVDQNGNSGAIDLGQTRQIEGEGSVAIIDKGFNQFFEERAIRAVQFTNQMKLDGVLFHRYADHQTFASQLLDQVGRIIAGKGHGAGFRKVGGVKKIEHVFTPFFRFNLTLL